jgi:hypothetical protein
MKMSSWSSFVKLPSPTKLYAGVKPLQSVVE